MQTRKKNTKQKFPTYASIVVWIALSAVFLGLLVNRKKLPNYSRTSHLVAFAPQNKFISCLIEFVVSGI